MQRLMRERNPAALRVREAEIQRVFEGVLAARLFPRGTARVDNTVSPRFSFACLDLLNKTSTRTERTAVEVHDPSGPDAHMGLVMPVIDDQGRLLGHIQLAVRLDLLRNWVKKIAQGAYLELYQKAKPEVLIARAGDVNLVGLTQEVVWPRKGTLWELRVWDSSAPEVSLLTPQSMSIIGVAVTLAGLMVFFLNRSMARTVRTDLANLVDMAVAAARGDKSYQFALRMQEFKEAARVLQDLPQGKTMTRERDDEVVASGEISLDSLATKPPAAGGTSDDDLATNPVFVSSDSLKVEEVDASAIPKPAAPQAAPAAAPNPFTSGGGSGGPTTSGASALPPPEIFKEYDIRGIVGATLTAQHAILIGKALGSEAINRGETRMAFARDGRLSGPELGAALVKGIQSTGIDVVDIGMAPTPVLYYAATELTDGTGVMLTGSHNPADYNGFKMMIGGETLSGDAIRELRVRIEKQDFATGKGGYQTQPVLKRYLDRIAADVHLKRALKVVVDCGNGVAGGVAPKLLKQLGCNIIELYCEVDGNFPHHHPDPSQPQNLQDLIEAVKVQRADIGIAFDGDGDRIGVVSPDGNIIWPDRLMMLYAEDILKRHRGAKIIYDIKCSSNLTKVIWDKGGEPLMWKTGHSLIKKKLKETGALLAGEMSGHIFFKERWYGFDDALYAAARLLEILSNDVRQPRVVLASLPDSVSTPELRIPLPEGENFAFMEKLMEQADFGDANITMIDGVRVDYANGWGLVRASNTTPALILRFEGQDQEALKQVQEKFRKVLRDVDRNVQLPF
ncbi:MAG TPA: phosphomannomutase/phosphoglucomutase [Gammaproteobacteria bacterium]|nr:phosphomannomutase/phosphoglucomutase [Gammaproteobacteria bacterium]